MANETIAQMDWLGLLALVGVAVAVAVTFALGIHDDGPNKE